MGRIRGTEKRKEGEEITWGAEHKSEIIKYHQGCKLTKKEMRKTKTGKKIKRKKR